MVTFDRICWILRWFSLFPCIPVNCDTHLIISCVHPNCHTLQQIIFKTWYTYMYLTSFIFDIQYSLWIDRDCIVLLIIDQCIIRWIVITSLIFCIFNLRFYKYWTGLHFDLVLTIYLQLTLWKQNMKIMNNHITYINFTSTALNIYFLHYLYFEAITWNSTLSTHTKRCMVKKKTLPLFPSLWWLSVDELLIIRV